MTDIAARILALRPGRSDVVLVQLDQEAPEPELRALAAELGDLADRTRATVLLLPLGVTVETIDDREMLARGWMRVGPLTHTTEQLARPTAKGDEFVPSHRQGGIPQ